MNDGKDSLGDRMKAQEAEAAMQRFQPNRPVVVRIDGRRFSKFTRGFRKPFDAEITRVMRETCAYLVDQTQARIGYVQSDEISLVLFARSEEDALQFSGRIQKITSTYAAMATARFMAGLMTNHGARVLRDLPTFDARAWQPPTLMEAVNAVIWRIFDARKNGVSAACRSVASPSEMDGLDGGAMIDLMSARGVDFLNDFHEDDRLGVLYQRRDFEESIDQETWDAIPEHARPESRDVLRSRVVEIPARDLLEADDPVHLVFGETIAPVQDYPRPMKQVIVVRKDLGMRRGKEIAQGSHASSLPVIENRWDPRMVEWLDGPFAKIVLVIDGEDDLLALAARAEGEGLLVSRIQDAGRTEFKGIPTWTAIAIGPDLPEKIDPLTGHLKLR